jgi:hypothetical protein
MSVADRVWLRAILIWRVYRQPWRAVNGAVLDRLREWITIGRKRSDE